MTEKKYFKVLAKCGHVGKRNYVPIAFAVIAKSRKEASKATRSFPRVKHDHKDAILSCDEITFEDYLELYENNRKDPYLNCHSTHEQNKIDLKERLVHDPHHDKKVKNTHKERKKYKQKKNRCLEASSEWLVYTINDFNKEDMDEESDEYEYCD